MAKLTKMLAKDHFCATLRSQRHFSGLLFKAMIIFFFSFCNGQPRRKNSVELITITWKTARFQGTITSSNDYSFPSATSRTSLPNDPISSRSLFFLALLASRQEFNGDWAKMKLERGSPFIILDAWIQQKIRNYNEGGWNSRRIPAIFFLSFNLLNQSWSNAKLSSVPKFISLNFNTES